MSSHLESKELLTTQQMDVSVNNIDDAMERILGIGLANLSSSSHGTSRFLWLLNSAGVNLSEGLSEESGQQFKLMKKMVLMILLMLNWGRSLFR